ncbi:MAG: pentapeptide repeat-containing protein [Myxococcota bacterium]
MGAMQNLQLKLQRLLPFLSPFHVPSLSLPPPPDPKHWQAHQTLEGFAQAGLRLENAQLSGLQLHTAALPQSHWQQVQLSEARLVSVSLPQARLEGVQLREAGLSLVDAEGAVLERTDFTGAQLVGCSLRDTRLEGCDLKGARIQLSDFFGCQLRRVKASNSVWIGVDATFAVLEEVDLEGADLRGLSLAHATLSQVQLTGAQVRGADFRGTLGLSDAQRLQLLEGGARLYDGVLDAFFARLLAARRPDQPVAQRDRLARGLSWATQGLLLLLPVLLAIPLFWKGPMKPENRGPEEAAAPGHTPVYREATAEEQAKTQENLLKLRAALQAAFDASGKYGVARYPTQEELANNEFDRDGNGPDAVKLPLLNGGLPGNFLTGGEGVSPYCNAVPKQETLTGDDVDWHYCEETGRIYACGGLTTAPTLSW